MVNTTARPLVVRETDGHEYELLEYDIDLAYGDSENNFVLQTHRELAPGDIIYYDGDEAGGVVDETGTDSEAGYREYRGRTWRGVMDGLVVCPPASQDYYVMRGGLDEAIERLFEACFADEWFRLGAVPTTSVVFQIDRYVTLWAALSKLLGQLGLRMRIRVEDGWPTIYIEPPEKHVCSPYEMNYDITTNTARPNALIVLGKGELRQRAVWSTWIEHGTVKTGTGSPGRPSGRPLVDVYELNDKEASELPALGARKFTELRGAPDTATMTYDGRVVGIAPGDIIEMQDDERHIAVSAYVTKIITKVSDCTETTTLDCSPRGVRDSLGANDETYRPVVGDTGATSVASAAAPLALIQTDGGLTASLALDDSTLQTTDAGTLAGQYRLQRLAYSVDVDITPSSFGPLHHATATATLTAHDLAATAGWGYETAALIGACVCDDPSVEVLGAYAAPSITGEVALEARVLCASDTATSVTLSGYLIICVGAYETSVAEGGTHA